MQNSRYLLMKKRIKHIFGGIKGTFVVLLTFLLFPLARLLFYHKHIWLISENRKDARDNGYVLFKYIREKHSKVNCYYTIDFDSPDYKKVITLGNVIKFGSLKHFLYYCAAKYIISTKTEGFCPSYYLILLRKHFHLFGKYIFLQHGITKDNQIHFYKKRAKFDLFICGAKPEYEDIKEKYGYSKDEVAYTGFSRFDTYHNLKMENKILIMPTWRRGLTKDNIQSSEYFNSWNEVLNSKTIDQLLKEKNIVAYFYIHPQFQSYTNLFKTRCDNICIKDFATCDLQEMIRNSKMLITDFSSVFFDFGYMKKPVIYYQFDENRFFEKHYIKGYFDYRMDGFGPVCNSFKSLVNELKIIINRDFTLDSKSLDNSERFFPLHDDQNSSRIFQSISKMR